MIDLDEWEDFKLELVQSAIDYLMTRTGNTDDVVIIYDESIHLHNIFRGRTLQH